MKTASILVLSLVATIVWCATDSSRPVPAWPYEKLESHSTHIVIAIPTHIRDAIPNDQLEPPKGIEQRTKGVVTTFKVQASLKGRMPENEFSIGHFLEIPVNGAMLGNGPCFVDFTSFVATDKEETPRLQFVLFLEKDKTNKFQFVTGSHDPIFSVKQIRQLPEY